MAMFSDIGIEMPKITLAVVAASNWLMKNYLIVILIVVALIVSIIAFCKSEKGKITISWLALRIPGVNNFVIKNHYTRSTAI